MPGGREVDDEGNQEADQQETHEATVPGRAAVQPCARDQWPRAPP